MVALNRQKVLVPVLLAKHELVFIGWPDDPFAAIAIDAACVVIRCWVDLKLQSLRNIDRPGLEARVEEDTAIAVAYASESERELEVFVILGGLKISIGFRDRISLENAVLDGPLLNPYGVPASQIHSIKELHPLQI